MKRQAGIAFQMSDAMKRFIQGGDRTQATLLPELLDDYITETYSGRVIDVYVDNLDLGDLGFEGVEPEATGHPSYHPAVLLKLHSISTATSTASSPPGAWRPRPSATADTVRQLKPEPPAIAASELTRERSFCIVPERALFCSEQRSTDD